MALRFRVVASLLFGLAFCGDASLGESLPLDQWKRHVIEAQKPWRSIFIASADLNQDGFSDIVTGGWWYENPGRNDGSWKRHLMGDPLHNMAATFDIDRDGDTDVLGTSGKGSSPSATFLWAENQGDGVFTIRDNIEAGQGDFLQGVAVGQFTDPDSWSVALSWHHGGNGIQILTVPPAPASQRWGWRQITSVSQDEQLSVGLIDDDTIPDLLLGTIWLRTDSQVGSNWTANHLHEPLGTPDRNRLFDMNQDGRLDAVVGYQAVNSPGKLAWYAQPSSPEQTWKEHLVAEVIGPMSLDVADIDGDGDADIVVGEHNYAAPQTARLLVFENLDGQATEWKQHLVHIGDEHHDGAVTVDIDNDGDLDVISIGWKEPEVWLYENLAIGK